MIQQSYHDKTFNARNPLRRWAHRTRFKNSLRAIAQADGLRVLDFGCGDGLFLNQLQASTDLELKLVGYEPYMESLPANNVPILQDWGKIVEACSNEGPFDFVTCFEVLEHFAPNRQERALAMMSEVLSKDGHLVLSVPIEIGVPALVKNLIRKRDSKGDRTVYSFRNIFKSFIGKSLPEFRSGDSYLSHMGFYYGDLEKLIVKHFTIDKKFYSPLGMFGHNCNSQVFYRLTPKQLNGENSNSRV